MHQVKLFQNPSEAEINGWLTQSQAEVAHVALAAGGGPGILICLIVYQAQRELAKRDVGS
jgi:hypothetical protein